MKNIILTPHTAALTCERPARLAIEAMKTAITVLQGRTPPRGIVANPEVLTLLRRQEFVTR